jgi:ATP-dependent Lon protease
MEKVTTNTFSFPTIILKDSLVHLPGVTFNLSVSLNDGFHILNLFLKTPEFLSPQIQKTLEKLQRSIQVTSETSTLSSLSKDVKKGNDAINQVFGTEDSKFPVFATLFADTDGHISNVAVISRLINIKVLPNQCILGLKGHCKAVSLNDVPTVNDDVKYKYEGELWYDVELPNSNNLEKKVDLKLINDVILGIKENLLFAEKFLIDYLSLDNHDFKSLLYKLNPLAELLHVQLSEPNMKDNLDKLKKLIKSIDGNNDDLNKIFDLSDIYVAIFPFSYNQKIKYLQTKTIDEKISIIFELSKFVNTLFNKYLDISYVFELWNMLGKLQNGKILQSKFIINHFNSLKQLLDKTANSNLNSGSNFKNSTPSKATFRNNKQNSMLNNNDSDDDNDLQQIEEFITNIDEYDISSDGKISLIKDFKRLKKMQSSTSEYQQLRNYMDIILELPWSKKSELSESKKDFNLNKAKEILDDDHFGMESVKERILEHLAILKLTKNTPEKSKSPILLLNGPPGVGKTSFAKSIAHSLNCEFQRVSLGGINDFADIKGHRRTYVGAIPGLLVQALRRSKSLNLVILLDEIDKVGMSNHKGNPEAALLEILDPEQNNSFTDHYIGFPIDLSKIIFIATSNDKWDITEPLLDRMEIIDLDGYNCKEKVKIAEQFILPRQLVRNGLEKDQVIIDSNIFDNIATLYTHEAGIRNFERLIGKICRKKAVELLTLKNKSKYKSNISKDDLIKYLGVPKSFADSEKYSSGNSLLQEDFGIVNGLSYNSNGSGSLLRFEMVGVPGSQRISSTGRLGEVLLESCEIAETLVEQLIHTHLFLNYNEEKLLKRLENTNVHMHVPEGSIKKDGPSAGLTMTLCYLSLILELPVDSSIAMTGEITLTAKALPIGGLKEKILGASLSGQIRKVIVPRLNRKDLITAYVESIQDREKAKLVLTKLVLEEEECLIEKNKRYIYSNDVENWVKEEYDIEIKYVDDFMDVIREVWDGNLKLLRKEVKAHL